MPLWRIIHSSQVRKEYKPMTNNVRMEYKMYDNFFDGYTDVFGAPDSLAKLSEKNSSPLTI